MSQHSLTIENQTFPVTREDINDALQALGSLQSGGTAPSPTFANQLWYDTSANVLKMQNENNNGWIELLDLNQSGGVAELISKLKAPNGTAGAPSITFDSDADLGIYRKAANTMAIVAGGTEVATFAWDGSNVTFSIDGWNIEQTTNDLVFKYGSTDRMLLDSDGGLTIY